MEIPKRLIVVFRKADSGDVDSLPGAFPSREMASNAASGFLFNQGVDLNRANRMAVALREEPASGIEVPIFSDTRTGMQFRILEADVTSDGTLITPGMRVADYDREPGTGWFPVSS